MVASSLTTYPATAVDCLLSDFYVALALGETDPQWFLDRMEEFGLEVAVLSAGRAAEQSEQASCAEDGA